MTKPTVAAAALAGCLCASSLFASAQFIPNTTKYRDSGLPVAKAKAGNASIEARALLGADGVTDVEITSGSFEGATAPSGTIEKVQIKLTNPDSTTNANNLSGTTYVEHLDGLMRHEPIDLHVNVKAGETTVVQTTETVKLRPSLQMRDFAGPAYAVAGAPVVFSAVAHELNGDVGARASCVLLANGEEVDRARNIWIDAGGSVTCRFAHTFSTPGAYDVRVRVTDSDPGDYRTGDDEAAGTIEVFADARPFDAWNWAAKDMTFQAHYIEERADFSGESRVQGWNQSSDFYAMLANRTLDLQAVRMSVHEQSDGETISDAEFEQFDASPICAWSFDGRGRMVSVCNLTSESGSPFVTVSVNRAAGDVTYLSWGWRRTFNPASGQYEYYTFNNDFRNTYGVQKRFGRTVSLTVAMWDGATLWEERPFMVLEPYTYTDNQPRTCGILRGRGYRCTEHEYSEEGTRGLVNYQ